MKELYNYSRELKGYLESLTPKDFKVKSFLDIDCGKLPLLYKSKAWETNDLTMVYYSSVSAVKGPVIYWFEIISHHRAEELHKIIQTLKGEIDRNVPAFKKQIDNDSKILYVGKVKSGFGGRVEMHLGFKTNRNTQGLQLCHWACKMKLKLRLHYIQLPSNLSDMVSLFENRLASRLHPVFGKHK